MVSLLAIETSTDACSAAIYHEGETLSRFKIAPQLHTSLILNMCDELLREIKLSPSQLSGIVFSRGPGSFTGVRIATAIAQGMAIAHDLPTIAISSLQALAQEAYLQTHEKKITAGFDAKMNEVYMANFILEKDEMILMGEERLMRKDQINKKGHWFCVGTAFQEKDIFYPSAHAMLIPALRKWKENKILPPEMALPVYLRDNVTF